MQYVLFTDKFGGYNGYMDPGKVGPNAAVIASDVDTSDGSLRPRFNDIQQSSPYDTTIAGSSKTIVPWFQSALGFDLRLAVAGFGTRLYRSHKGFSAFPASLDCIQYTSTITSNPTWDCLGLSQPRTSLSVTASTSSGSLAAGTYSYCTTLYNDAGHESPPCVAVQATLSATGKMILASIPRSYGKITYTSGSTSATITENISRYRAGMRITTQASGVLSANTYITSINYTTGAITLSSAALLNSSDETTRDAQIAGMKIYRAAVVSGRELTFQHIATLVGFSTSGYDDTGATAGEALSTQANVSVARGIRDIAISASGVMTGIDQDGNVIYFSLASPGLYDPTQAIPFPGAPLSSIYALNRFIFPTQDGAFSMSIEDPTGIPVLSIIDSDEPCVASDYVYCLDVGGSVWWNTNRGIVSTDGNSITPITRYILTKEENEKLKNCFGMIYTNGDIYIYGDAPTILSEPIVYFYSRETGWVKYTIYTTSTISNVGTIGFHRGFGEILYTGNTAAATKYVYRLCESSTRYSGSVYATGAWSGEHASNLKKFRKLSVVHSGSGSSYIQPIVDGVYIGSPLEFTSTGATKRSSFWLQSGLKGRDVQVALYLSTGVSIQEVGVWVGEQREAMP